jgi:putative nucleotidyltransferase with HDIG domain
LHQRYKSALGYASFSAFALAGLAAAVRLTAGSPALAWAAVIAVATAAAMQARLATGRWRAAALVVLSAALLSLIGGVPRLVGAVLLTGLAGAELIARCTRRSEVLQAGSWAGLIAGLTSLSGLAATVPLPPGLVLREALGAVAVGFLSGPVVLTLGPVAEWLFGHITRLTMSEWLSYEGRLLRELAAAAPGTFQHSINVGVLANAAAGAVDGDALLARVGGLYHDVGKIRAPGFFIENQQGTNPHDSLEPRESARILRAHVTDGVEAVRAHRMGDRIADFVREHHGTGTMRVFEEKAGALGLADPPGTYQYPGPAPRSRETAIVMIADQLEATARSSPPADEAACDAMVERTIERIRAEGQLKRSGLTTRELQAARAAFARALQAMYHRRLTNPPSGTPSPVRQRLAFLPRALTRRRAGT